MSKPVVKAPRTLSEFVCHVLNLDVNDVQSIYMDSRGITAVVCRRDEDGRRYAVGDEIASETYLIAWDD